MFKILLGFPMPKMVGYKIINFFLIYEITPKT